MKTARQERHWASVAPSAEKEETNLTLLAIFRKTTSKCKLLKISAETVKILEGCYYIFMVTSPCKN